MGDALDKKPAAKKPMPPMTVSARKLACIKGMEEMDEKLYDFTNAEQLREWLATFPDSRMVVALYARVFITSQDEWLNALAGRLKKRDFVTVGIADPAACQHVDLSEADATAIIPANDIASLDRINIFVISDHDGGVKYPESARILACCHAFTAYTGNDCLSKLEMPVYVDGWLAPFPFSEGTRQKTADLWNGFHRPDLCRRKNNKFYLIPSGYPRAGLLSEKLAAISQKPDSIVYAPVGVSSYPDKGGERLKEHGPAIIRTLLDSFPEKNIIFRPYRKDIEDETVKSIRSLFAPEKRFIFDASNDKTFSFSHGEVLVTDYSHISLSFAFCSLRPSVLFRPWDKSQPEKKECAEGFLAATYTGLVSAIKEGLSERERTAARIKKYRERSVMPFEHALDDLADLIPDFYHDRPRPEWLVIERNNPHLLQSETEILGKLAGKGNPAFLAAALVFSNPSIPYLAALALETGKRLLPKNFIWHGAHIRAGAILGKDLSYAKCYADIPDEDIERLWEMSRQNPNGFVRPVE